MFYFDEKQEQARGGEDSHFASSDERMQFRTDSYRSRRSEGFILGDFDDDFDEELERESAEQLAEMVPMRMHLHHHHSSSGLRKPRSRSHSGGISFFDFYSLLDDRLGEGSYGSVKTCVQRTSGMEYAVKIVDRHASGHSKARIQHEVSILQLCADHPNIVQLVDWFEDRDRFYLVFEKMRGGPLLTHIQRKVCFTEAEAVAVTRDIASALKFLHDHGIAHRDVKPENILCTEADRVSPVKLCDLDLASHPHHTVTSMGAEPELASPVGSAEFMAPEVVDAFVGDALKYDKRCDMWSLGVIVYIMLCGYPPFYGGDCESEECGWDEGESCDECQNMLFQRIQAGHFEFPSEEWNGVSEEAKHLITHLLQRDATKRMTADEVLSHPWLAHPAPHTLLQTPSNLFRNDSARDVHQMIEHFNVISRLAGARLSSQLEGEESPASASPPSPGGVCFPNLFPAASSSSCLLQTVPAPQLTLLQLPESCQSAVARQDSMNDMRQVSNRHGEVNV